MSSILETTTNTPQKKKQYNPTDIAINISETVISHAGIDCSHCTKILKQVIAILEASKN